jgi:hypothetical protein
MFGATGTLFSVAKRAQNDWKVCLLFFGLGSLHLQQLQAGTLASLYYVPCYKLGLIPSLLDTMPTNGNT